MNLFYQQCRDDLTSYLYAKMKYQRYYSSFYGKVRKNDKIYILNSRTLCDPLY